ncbi:type VI secretion protein VasK [Providencia sp. R33]|uniref:ImcF-related family protein n=1 Tax=Providencia sp. R33 TaxID=2828763 RepID=UPI001C5AFB8D|nr:type VI secretion protein VasK [Providencia sp. R33]
MKFNHIKSPLSSTVFILLCVLLGILIWEYGDKINLQTKEHKLFAIVAAIALAHCARQFIDYITSSKERRHNRNPNNTRNDPEQEKRVTELTHTGQANTIKNYLHFQYGLFWRRKVSIQLLIGSPAAVDKLAPRLSHEIWQESNGTVLIYGGEVAATVNDENVLMLKQLRRRRPVDALIWVTEYTVIDQLMHSTLNVHHLNTATSDMASRFIYGLFKALKWQAPVWVWNVSDNPELCSADAPAVLCLTEPYGQPEQLTPALRELVPLLSVHGAQALSVNLTHTYWLILAQFLRGSGSEELAVRLAPLTSGIRRLPFAGLAFSTAVTQPSEALHPHTWQEDNRWKSLLAVQGDIAPSLQPSHLGINPQRVMQYAVATGMAVWGVGLAVSYFANRQLMNDSQQLAFAAVDNQRSAAERLNAQFDFQQMLGKLDHRATHFTPVWQRFGLNHNDALLDQLWPTYTQTILPLLRDNTRQQLEAKLQQYAELPPDSPARADATPATYALLKAYLMMSSPERMEPEFFTQTVLESLSPIEGVNNGEWQTLGRELLAFYADQLPQHADWAINKNRALISSSRNLLVRQIGQRNGESALYQKILLQAKNSYAEMTLDDMTEGTDVSFLFTTDEFIPGVFTRRAWETTIEPAINRAVEARRDEIDWVLSDNQQPVDSDISPEQLKQRLTERYFADFAGSWLNLMNSLQWRHTENLSDTIDQLTLMGDVRQSPVIALMNTLSYQGKTGRQQEKLTDSFINSTKELLNKDKKPVISQKAEFSGPLEATFGPVLNLTDSQASSNNSDNLSLQAYLTRVTRVRLKLQQIANAPDPQAMSQALAQSIFEGKTVDLSETRDYGSLIAASLGQEWSGFGESLLVQPMNQAWEQLLTPTAEGINAEWQNAIVNEWNTAFGGRYPLKNTQSEISLPLMAQYLRPDNGRIQRFLETRLKGVLRKEGNRWVPNNTTAQGLRFNPEFLKALDTLSHLGDVAFANGEARLYFEIRPSTSRDVMQTILVIDKQTLTYDNQFPEWQRFVWPGDTIASGASLRWMSTTSGTRLLADHRGVWGVIRLLESAQVAPYAGTTSSYTVSWQTKNGNTLPFMLRTEMGDGPLALLTLRNFVLPRKIFLD